MQKLKEVLFFRVQFDEQQADMDESKYVTARDSLEEVSCLTGYLLDRYHQEIHGTAILGEASNERSLHTLVLEV